MNNRALRCGAILLCTLVFSGCAAHYVAIRAVKPSNRVDQALRSDSRVAASQTPEQCFLSVEEMFKMGVQWFPSEAKPLFVDDKALSAISAHANYMIKMLENHEPYWYGHSYSTIVMYRAAWAEMCRLIAIDAGSTNIKEWDRNLQRLVRARLYSDYGARSTTEQEWSKLHERTRHVIDLTYDDMDFLKQYLSHFLCSNILAPNLRDSSFYIESIRTLYNLQDRQRARFSGLILPDIIDIEKKIKYFKLEHKSPHVKPDLIDQGEYSDDISIPIRNYRNPDAVAVVIGIDKYKSSEVTTVKYARHGARRIRDLLKSSMGYDPKSILPQDENELITIGTMKTLVKSKLQLFVRPDESDVFVYIACHGVPLVDNSDIGLVAFDGDPNYASRDNAYALKELYDDLSKLNPRKLILVLDCCFSDRDGSGEPLIRDSSPIGTLVKTGHFFKSNYFEFLACKNNQLSNWFTEKNHSVFTYLFLKGMSGEADGYVGRRDGIITVEEVKEYLEDERKGVNWHSLRYCGRPQNPVVYGINLTIPLIE